MTFYIAPHWKKAFAENDLQNFDMLWAVEAELIDDANVRRGGIGTVAKLQLSGQMLYIKRQDSQTCRHPRWPWLKIPTLRRERNNIDTFEKDELSAPELVAYAECGKQTLLITRELQHCVDLENYYHNAFQALNYAQQLQFIATLAAAVAELHKKHWQHTALYPKHIFVNLKTLAISFIDLEGARKRYIRKGVLRDLDSLHRHFSSTSLKQRLFFLRNYCQSREQYVTLLKRLKKIYMRKVKP